MGRITPPWDVTSELKLHSAWEKNNPIEDVGQRTCTFAPVSKLCLGLPETHFPSPELQRTGAVSLLKLTCIGLSAGTWSGPARSDSTVTFCLLNNLNL